MTPEHAPAVPADAADAAVEEADQRGLAELLTRELAGRTPAELAGDDRIGASFLRQTVDRVVQAVLAAGWRPPAPTLTTQAQLAACTAGTVVTDRDGHPWAQPGGAVVRAAADRVYPDELVQWAPLSRHFDGPGPCADR